MDQHFSGISLIREFADKCWKVDGGARGNVRAAVENLQKKKHFSNLGKGQAQVRLTENELNKHLSTQLHKWNGELWFVEYHRHLAVGNFFQILVV